MQFHDFPTMIEYLHDYVRVAGKFVPPTRWQSTDVSAKPDMATIEVSDIFVRVRSMPSNIDVLAEAILPNRVWADEHFSERVGGEPLNPPPSWVRWPYAHSAAKHLSSEQFSHTYPERMWPSLAGDMTGARPQPRQGIRFLYGEASDVVRLLAHQPLTRQAFLPIWFPEDTGTVHGERVPCSLGYHFQQRAHKLNIAYFIRSCDLLRHLRDDVYLAARLVPWVIEEAAKIDNEWSNVEPGTFSMWIGSLHCFVNDYREMFHHEPPK